MMALRMFTSYKAKVMFTCVQRLVVMIHALPFRGVPDPFRLGEKGGRRCDLPNFHSTPVKFHSLDTYGSKVGVHFTSNFRCKLIPQFLTIHKMLEFCGKLPEFSGKWPEF